VWNVDDHGQARIDALEAKVARLEAALSAAAPGRPPTTAVTTAVAVADDDVALSRRRLLWGGGAVAAGAAAVVLGTPSPAAADGAQGVSFTPPPGPPPSGISANNVHDALVELDNEKVNKSTFWLNVRDANVVGNGTADDTAALQAALTWMGGLGGGTVFLPPGRYKITAPVTVPHGVDLWGSGGNNLAGTPATVIQANHSTAQLVFGQPSGVVGSRSGQSGNFVVDGLDVAAPAKGLVLLDLCVERQFTALGIVSSRTDGLVLEQTQNCTFTALQVSASRGNGLVLTRGAGGNAFVRCEFEQSGANNVWIRSENPINTGDQYHGVPQHNLFLHCILERKHTSVTPMYSCLRVTDGLMNKFSHCVFALDGSAPTAGHLVEVSVAGQVTFDDCRFSGDSSPAISGIRNNAAGVTFMGVNTFYDTPVAVQWDNTPSNNAFGELLGQFAYNGVPTKWASNAVGTTNWKDKAFQSSFPFSAAVDPLANYHLRTRTSDTGYRFQVGPQGQVQLNDGVGFTPKAELKLPTVAGDTAGGWETPHHVRLNGGALALQKLVSNPPTTLTNVDSRATIYVKNNLLVIAYRVTTPVVATHYLTMPLDGSAAAVWTHGTTAPP
jgi:hypothetical protein